MICDFIPTRPIPRPPSPPDKMDDLFVIAIFIVFFAIIGCVELYKRKGRLSG